MPFSKFFERRLTERRTCYLRAEVRVSAGVPALDCSVMELNPNGARLRFPRKVHIPDHVEVFLPLWSETVTALVRWRRDFEVGVEFVVSPETAQAYG